MGGLLAKHEWPVLAGFEAFLQPGFWQQTQWQRLLRSSMLSDIPQERLVQLFGSLEQAPLHQVSPQPVENLSYESLSMGFDSYRLIFFNGEFCRDQSDEIPGVKVTSVADLKTDEAPGLIHMVNAEPLAQLVDATATAGVVIEVSEGVVPEKPIYLMHLDAGAEGEVCSYRHHLIAGRASSCEVVEHYVSLNQGGGLTLSRLTTEVREGADYKHLKLVAESDQQTHIAHNDLMVKRDAVARSTTLMFSGAVISHQTSSALEQENGQVEMNSLSLPVSEQRFRSQTCLRHLAPHCISRQMHKVIAGGAGKNDFEGLIYVDEKAQKTDGQMDSHQLMLSPDAQVNSQPQLEIYADDVKCSHGATSGQLDKQQIDYMRARGIPENQARQMITFAFAAEVAQQIRHPVIRDDVNRMIRQRLTSGAYQ